MIYGIIIGVAIPICLGLSFYFGYKLGQKNKTAHEKQIDEVAKRQMELRREGLQNILNYNMETAMQRRIDSE